MTTAVATGAQLEDLAIKYLQAAGLIILHRNFHCRYGEVDLIVNDKGSLVFAEIRYRKNANYGHPAETVTPEKQKKIIQTAQFYLQTRSWAANLACRFDVIAMSKSADAPEIEWIKDAFHA